MIRHIVLINWKKDVSTEAIGNWIRLCNRIPDECPMVHNWCSSHAVDGPDPNRPSTHEFGILFDLPSREEWVEYLKHPYPNSVYAEGTRIIDLERTASTNILVETEPRRART
jgi:hypothetical protein